MTSILFDLREADLRKEEEDLEAIAAKETKVFRYEALAAATHNFSSKHKLGEGGFGPVYKVVIGKSTFSPINKRGEIVCNTKCLIRWLTHCAGAVE